MHSWPEDKVINWTEIGRQCNIESKNKGQVAKSIIAENSGIPSARLCSNRKKSSRRSMAKLPGKEVSMPSMPSLPSLKSSINALIDSGELSLGELCCPFTLEKGKVVAGAIEKSSSMVYGRKIPLLEIRKKLIQKQEKFMHLLSDEEIESMTTTDLRAFTGVDENCSNADALKSQLKTVQRTRHLALWHDHSSILGAGYTIHVLYDSAVFFSSDQFKQATGEIIDIQEKIEEPELYILCLSGSSPTDQVGTIADRLDCLLDLHHPLHNSSGIPISDKLLFFVGDHPAKAFERGSQIGGNYKCGSCGCETDRISDFAHVFRCSWRSLEHLQKLVLEGKFGNSAGILKPFDKLLKRDLQDELRKRKLCDVETLNKDQLTEALTSTLRGAQRVPT